MVEMCFDTEEDYKEVDAKKKWNVPDQLIHLQSTVWKLSKAKFRMYRNRKGFAMV